MITMLPILILINILIIEIFLHRLTDKTNKLPQFKQDFCLHFRTAGVRYNFFLAFTPVSDPPKVND
jgi:hypothetical protein